MKEAYSFLKKWKISTAGLTKMIFLSLATSLLSLAQPEVLRQATAAISERNAQLLFSAMVFAIVTALLSMAFSYCKDISSRTVVNDLDMKFGALAVNKLTSTKMRKLSKMRFGDVSAAVIRSVELFADSSVRYTSTVATAYFSLGFTFLYMCIVEWKLALCVLVYNLIIRFFAVFVERKMKKNSKDCIAAAKESGNELNAQLRNMLMVRIYSNGEFFKERILKREDAVRKRGWMQFVWSNGFQDHIWAFSKLAEFLIVYGVGAVLIYQGLSEISILMTFVFANDLFTIGINNLAYSMESKADAKAHRENLESILNESEFEDETIMSVHNPVGEIEFRNVSFSYGDRPVLNNVSFKILPGEHVLLTGPNGQGKSTILKLLSGLYRPQSGTILWNGEDISKINISGLQKSYGYISQHSHMLDGGVTENLVLSEKAESNKVESVLKSLRLSDTIHTDPQRLSMGEQQRLNIGRVLYRDSCELLLCDEIFSNVDKDNRQTVAAALEEKFPTATVLMISHEEIPYRIDRILRVENGCVEEVRS